FIATNIIGWRPAKATVSDTESNIKKERDIIYQPYGDIVSATCADTYMRFKERWPDFDDSWKGPLTDFLLKMGVDIDINEYTPRELEELVEAAVSRAHISMVSISRELGLDYFYYNVPGKQDPKFWTGRIPQTFDDLIKQEKTRRENIAKIINSSDITEHFYVEGEAMAFAVEQGDKRYIVIKNNTDRKQEGMAHIRFPESNKPFVLKDESLLGENIIFVPGKNVFDGGTIYFKLEKQQGHVFRVDLLESTLQSANSLFVKAVTPKESISDVSCKASSALLADDRTNKKYLLGILMVLFCAVLISFKPFLVTKGLYEGEHLSPLTAQANYYIYSFLVLLVYRSRSLNHYFKEKIWNNVSPNNKAHFMRLTYKERTILLAGIFLGQFVASPFTYLSWAYTSPIITEVIVKAAPIIVAFLAALFFHEILTYKQGIGIGICFLGAMGVIFGREMSGLGEGEHLLYVTPAGLIFAVISCIGYSFSEIVKKATRGFKDKFGVIDVLFWSYLISSPIMIIAASLFGGGFRLIINWYIIGIVAISLLSLLLSYKSLDYLKVSVSKSINNTSPVFVLIISTILFPTSSLSILSVMGVVLTVIGVTIVSIGGNGLNGIVKADTKKADSTIVNRGSKHVTLGKPNNSRKKREVIRITSFSDLVYNRLETKKVVFGLDLGCGVGDKTALIEAMLIDRFENVIFRGVDNSEERVAEAIAAGNHVDYFNAEKLKQDTKLDLITVLSPMPGDLPAFINIAQKHIKPDGLVIISLASRDMRSLLKNEVLFGQITSGYVWQIFKDFDLVQFEGMGSVLSVLKAGRYAFVYPGFGQSNIPESISSPASFGVGFYHAITARAMFEAPGIYPFLKRYSDSFRYLGLDIHRIVSFLYAQKIISHSIGFLPNDFVIAYHRDGCMFWSDEINAEGQTAKEEIVRKVADCLYKQGNLYFTPDIIIEQIKTHEFMPTEHKAIHAQWNKFRLYDYQKANRGQTVMAFTLSGAGKPIYFHKKNHFTPSHNLPSGVVEYLDFGRFILFQDGFSFENISYYQGPAIMAHGGTVDGVLSVNEIPLSTVIAHLFDVFSLNISRLLILSCNRFNGIVSTFLPCVYSTGMINDTRCRIPLEAVLDLKDTPYEDSFGGIVESFHLDQNDWYVVTSAHGDNWRVDDLPLKDQAEKERFGEGHLLWNVKALRELGSESLLGDDNRDIFYFYHEDEESSSSLNMENYFRSKNIRDIIDIAHLTMPGMDSFDEVLFAASLKELKHRGLKIIAITSSDDTTDHLKFFGSSLYDLEDIYYLSDLTHIVEALSVTFDAEDFIRMTAGNVLEHINMGSCVITAQSIDDSYGRKDIVTVFDNGYGFRALKGEQRSIRTVLQLGKTLDPVNGIGNGLNLALENCDLFRVRQAREEAIYLNYDNKIEWSSRDRVFYKRTLPYSRGVLIEGWFYMDDAVKNKKHWQDFVDAEKTRLNDLINKEEASSSLTQIAENFVYSTGNPLIDYLIRLEFLSSIGVLKGNVVYPMGGNDFFPAYFSRVFSIDHARVLRRYPVPRLKEEAVSMGLPERFEGEYTDFSILQTNLFDQTTYFPFLQREGGMDILFVKGVTDFLRAQYTYPGARLDLFGLKLKRVLSELFKNMCCEVLKPGGFVVIADKKDLWLSKIFKGLSYKDFFEGKDDEEYRYIGKILRRKRRQVFIKSALRVNALVLVAGQVPIVIFQKPEITDNAEGCLSSSSIKGDSDNAVYRKMLMAGMYDAEAHQKRNYVIALLDIFDGPIQDLASSSSPSSRRRDRGESKWDIFDRFVRKLGTVDIEILRSVDKVQSIGKKRKILLDIGLEEAVQIDGSYFLNAISKVCESAERSSLAKGSNIAWTDLLSFGGVGRYLICYKDIESNDGLAVKIPNSSQALRYIDAYALNGADIAKHRLGNGLSAGLMVID
ncbi:MAG: EamA family transporter, partial [Candidatus Omnitrophota bacterium]